MPSIHFRQWSQTPRVLRVAIPMLCGAIFTYIAIVGHSCTRDNTTLTRYKRRTVNAPEINTENDRLFDYKGEMARLNAARVAPDDPRLVRLIREHYILPPSWEHYSLVMPHWGDFSKDNVSTKMDEFLKHKRNGFFIECGAFDGEYKSTSLFFERERQWTGLLVEADPVSFARLRYKNRKAFTINACLSTSPYPEVIFFNAIGEIGRVLDNKGANYLQKAKTRPQQIIPVQCFPLYSILLALGNPTVDFFALDIEGAELDVLRTVPLDTVSIDHMLVEHAHIEEGLGPLQELLVDNGYEVIEIQDEDIMVRRTHKGDPGDYH